MPSHVSAFRLRKHADYQRVYKRGRKKQGKLLPYFVAQRTDVEGSANVPAEAQTPGAGLGAGPRIGLTVPKVLGKAVVRNRIKRRLRAAVRHCLPLLSAPVDLILHPRKTVEHCPFAELRQEVSVIFRSVQKSMEREPAPQAATHSARGLAP